MIRNQHLRKPTSRGFSLIELLIVICIIVMLAAVLFPVFAKAKEGAYRTAAINQAKQLGTGMQMYTDQNDQKLLPSTNYGVPQSSKGRIWTTVLAPLIKNETLFIAPESDGKFADSWDSRGQQTIGYNSSTAVDKVKGCDDDAVMETCTAFKTVASFSKEDSPAKLALLAVTPGGEVADKYLGYEFNPYNGTPADKPEWTPPLCSDRDLVKELGPTLPADLIKPIYARYLSTGSDEGFTPIIFADGHAKEYSARQIHNPNGDILWRLR